jgi:hypothetical protein
VVEHLPHQCEALSSNPSTTKKAKKTKQPKKHISWSVRLEGKKAIFFFCFLRARRGFTFLIL